MTTTTPTVYELMVICTGDLSDADFAKEFDSQCALIKEHGDITHKENWGVRKLPVKIKKITRGHFGLINFTAPPTAIVELREALRLNMLVLRSLITIVPIGYKYGSYTSVVIPLPVKEESQAEKREARKPAPPAKRKSMPIDSPKHQAAMESPMMSSEEQQEKLRMVGKKLDDILDNPDLDL